MTFKEEFEKKQPGEFNLMRCPRDKSLNMDDCENLTCIECWNREIPEEETEEKQTIKDSGERREFESGAVRDMAEGKGDMMSLPPNALLRLSKLYEAGAKKYTRFNYLKGIPCTSFLDSALRHLFKYMAGWDDEDHLASAVFNILGIMEMEHINKNMQDIPNRANKKTFEYGGD